MSKKEDVKQENLGTEEETPETEEEPQDDVTQSEEVSNDVDSSEDVEPSGDAQGDVLPSKGEGKFSRKNIIAGVAVLALAAGVFWIAAGDSGDWLSSREVVASVNGENITKEMLEKRINQSRALYESQGADLDDAETYGMVEEQVLQSMVQEELILQDAKDQNVTATQEEIDAEMQQVRAQFGDDAEFEETLATYNMSEADLLENIEVQVIIQNYLDGVVDEGSLSVTDEEVNEFYATYSEGQDSAAPLSEIREQIENELIQQKRQAEIERILQDLEEAGEVELHI